MRTYEKTHPWLSFVLDAQRLSHRVWLLLGEARSKCDHIAGVPLKPAVSQRLHFVYLAKGVQATTAIEGNTLTELEVRKRIEGQLELPLSREYLGREVDNVVRAINEIAGEVFEGQRIDLVPDQIRVYNRQVLDGLDVEEGVIPGEIPEHDVRVGTYAAPSRADSDYLLERLCKWLNSPDFRSDGEMRLPLALLRAVVAHLYLAWIHYFGDGNGRTARLVEFQILVSAGVPTPAAHLLSNHYNQTRTEYYRQLERASRSGGDVAPFIEYALQGFVDGLKEQLEFIRVQQWEIAWRDYVYEKFEGQKGSTVERRRRLVLDMSRTGTEKEVFRLSEVRLASAKLSAAYATKTDKTVRRDLNELRRLGLIEQTKSGFRAKREIILAFLPARNPSATS